MAHTNCALHIEGGNHTMSDQLEVIKNAVIDRKIKEIEALVKEALDRGLEPDVIINDGLIPAMDVVGARFGEGKIFVPEMLVSAKTMSTGLNVLKPLLKAGSSRSAGKIILGTVRGDLHDIGKNIVAMMLEGAGFEVVDLGVNLSVERLIEEVRNGKPQLVGLSALLTTTLPEMQNVIQALKDQNLREQVKVIIGGAPVDARFAEKIGADGYAADAAQAVTLSRKLVAA